MIANITLPDPETAGWYTLGVVGCIIIGYIFYMVISDKIKEKKERER